MEDDKADVISTDSVNVHSKTGISLEPPELHRAFSLFKRGYEDMEVSPDITVETTFENWKIFFEEH